MGDYIHPKATTVWLEYNGSDHFEPYFCSRCRQMIMQHKGEIITEEPGIAPHATPMLIQCKQCKRKYNFIGFVHYPDAQPAPEVVIHEKIRLDYFYK